MSPMATAVLRLGCYRGLLRIGRDARRPRARTAWKCRKRTRVAQLLPEPSSWSITVSSSSLADTFAENFANSRINHDIIGSCFFHVCTNFTEMIFIFTDARCVRRMYIYSLSIYIYIFFLVTCKLSRRVLKFLFSSHACALYGIDASPRTYVTVENRPRVARASARLTKTKARNLPLPSPRDYRLAWLSTLNSLVVDSLLCKVANEKCRINLNLRVCLKNKEKKKHARGQRHRREKYMSEQRRERRGPTVSFSRSGSGFHRLGVRTLVTGSLEGRVRSFPP